MTSLLAATLVMASCFGFSMSANAYWDFGVVGLTLGKTEVNLSVGQTEAVSVTLKPASHDQLPGCGMEKCPSTCGEKNCYDNVYGQCICNGSTLSTYYPTATVSSSSPGVATATYNNGVVTIRGVSEGETEITVVGSLRQWTDSPEETITVSVKEEVGGSAIPADQIEPDGSGNSGNSGSTGNSGDSTNAIVATEVTEDNNTGTSGTTSGESTNGTTGAADNTQAGTQAGTAAGTTDGTTDGTAAGTAAGTETEAATASGTESEAETEDGITSLEVEDGTYWFVPITGLPQGKEQFEQIMGDERQYVDFQLKDDAENVIYAWEFWGKDVERAEDMVFTIEESREAFEGCSYGSPANSLYLTFAEEGEFVGRTSIFYRVSEYFSNGVLYLYRYNPEDDSIELVAEELTISNGYVTLPLTEGGSFILTTEELMDAPEGMEEEIEQQPEELDVDALAETEPEESTDENAGLSTGALVAIIIVIAAAAAAVIIFLAVRAVRKKKNGPGGDGTGEDESEFWVEAGEEDDGNVSESPEARDGDASVSPEENDEEGFKEETREE